MRRFGFWILGEDMTPPRDTKASADLPPKRTEIAIADVLIDLFIVFLVLQLEFNWSRELSQGKQ